MRRILLVGGGGYVGSRLAQSLIKGGAHVTVFDTFWYGSQHLKKFHDNLKLIKGDLRDVPSIKDALSGIDDVIHLACISNDPSFDLNPSLGKSINLDSMLPFVKALNKSNVSRVIYASSSSVYGIKTEERVTELLRLEPLTDYSKYKAACEDILFNELSDEITASVLRPATICGYSPRQRFDLVVNIMTASALVDKTIKVFGGVQYRPNLHIKDMVNAYELLLRADSRKVNREIYNVGGQNLTLSEIAKIVQSCVNSNVKIETQNSNDMRSYRIDSAKLINTLGFEPSHNVHDAVIEIISNFQSFGSHNPLQDARYINILRMKELNLG